VTSIINFSSDFSSILEFSYSESHFKNDFFGDYDFDISFVAENMSYKSLMGLGLTAYNGIMEGLNDLAYIKRIFDGNGDIVLTETAEDISTFEGVYDVHLYFDKVE